jgi:LPS-assembly protein
MQVSLLLVLAQLPFTTPSGADLPPGERVQLDADHLTYEPSLQQVTARGDALLRTDQLQVRADEVSYSQLDQRAVARGRVMLVMERLAAVADEVSVDVRSLQADVAGGLVMQKEGVDPALLREARTPEELRALGDTSLALAGTRIRKLGPGRFAVDGLSFTPCHCKSQEPGWRIDARSAEVELGESAALTWPVVYVGQVPVFVLPWLHLPLSSRRSGLLAPRPADSSLGGLSLEQPVFLTLGDSADVTFTPGYFLGREGQPFGMKGPRLHTELRYVPSEGTQGRITLGALYDLHPRRDPVNPDPALASGRRGLRFEGSVQHVGDLGHGVKVRADLSGVSDGYYVKDLTADVLLRETQYLRSTAVLSRQGEDDHAGLEVVLRQDTRWGYSAFDTDRTAAGEPLHGPSTLHRLPALTWAALDRPLWGPVLGGVTVEYARIAPIRSGTGDEGTSGVFDPLDPEPDGSQGNRRFEPGEREARDRLEIRPRLQAQLRAGELARITPFLAYRQDLYLGEVTGRVSQRGYPLAGLAVDTQLSRTFGADQSIRHTISPSVEVRSIPAVFGAPPGEYDEVDAAAAGPLLQAMVGVDQRLLSRTGGQVHELVRLDVGQGVDLLARRLSDSYARLQLRFGWVALDTVGRYSLPERRVTQASASVTVDDGQGRSAYGRYELLVVDGSERQRRRLDSLVGGPSPLGSDAANPDHRAQLLTAGAAYRFGFGLSLRYDAVIQPGAQTPSRIPLNPLAQQILTAGYTPSCDCWRVDLTASLTRTEQNAWSRGVGLRFTLDRLGSFGT